MTGIHSLIELDHYFKNYVLYREFLGFRYKNEKKIIEALNAFKELGISTDAEKREYEKLQSAIKEIEENHFKLEEDFANFDFSTETVKNNLADYKIITYQFVKDNLDRFVQEKDKEEIPVNSMETFLDQSLDFILDFFKENFFYNADLLETFIKAKDDVYKKRIGELNLANSS